jgi:hypothetical protein|tara:strand:+ start:1417 stop:2058 length:642 start_codon:yes stop_codon:yes gene_type:complete
MTTTTKNSALTVFEEAAYSHMQHVFDRYKPRVMFTDAAKARMGQIVGYIIAMKQAGNTEFAESLAESIDTKINQLSPVENMTEFSVGDGQVVEVPARKATLHDDGTFHGFSILWYQAVDINRYREVYQEIVDANSLYILPSDATIEKLGIQERVNPHDTYSDELTHHKYIEGEGSVKIYYTQSHNGGLIYHGPGAGETFTTNLGGEALWGIHT